MAEAKKTKATAKKNNKDKSGEKKSGSGAKKQTKAQLEQLRIQQELEREQRAKKRNQTAALIIFAVSLVFLSLVLISAEKDSLWYYIRGTVFGILGYSAFILPVVSCYAAIMMSMEKIKQSAALKLLEGWLLTVFISALAFVIAHDSTIRFTRDVSNEFYKYFDSGSIGWGLFGAVVGELLMLIGSSKAPAAALCVIFIFLSFMALSGITLGSLTVPFKKLREKIEKARREADEAGDGDYYDSKYDDGEKKRARKGDKNKKRAETSEEENGESEKNEAPAEQESGRQPKQETRKGADEDSSGDSGEEDIFAIAAKKQEELEAKKLTREQLESEERAIGIEAERLESDTDGEREYLLPPLDCLNLPIRNPGTASQADLRATADKLIAALNSFNVEAKVIDVVPGPSVTRYELAPAPGVKISKFTGLADDLALHLAAPAGVRIEAPIPNKSAIGIEVPNRGRTTVTMREIVDSDIYAKASSKSLLSVALGKDIAGNVVCADLAKMPHLLIAGTTGSGKSVCLNAMIVSLLYNARPDQVRLLLIDPKQVEFSVYNDIPHLLVPVVSDARKAAGALGWAVTEMLSRYKTLNDNGVRDIGAYNKLCEERPEMKKMAQIVIVIDELSDLMSVAPGEVENSITRLAQMARAAGMHLVVATQRPSVDVITGLIKANIPSRIALSVSSQVDSRTILDASGAEKLLGLGDMLFCPVGVSKPRRVQGCYLSDAEIERVIDFVKTQETSSYSEDIQQEIDKQAVTAAAKKSKDSLGETVGDTDSEIVMKAAELVIDNPEKASISSLQRHLSLGFAKAGRIMDALEDKGVVGPHAGSKPRKVLLSKAQWLALTAGEGGSEQDGEDGDE